MEKGNSYAFYHLAGFYARGIMGMPLDWAKANELLLKAGELGCATAYCNLGNSYNEGLGVDRDETKTNHYHELAAINGNVDARNRLGCLEYNDGNLQRAYKHYMIGAMAGCKSSLDDIKEGFMQHGDVTKDEYAKALRGYQKWQNEVRSEARDKAEKAHLLMANMGL